MNKRDRRRIRRLERRIEALEVVIVSRFSLSAPIDMDPAPLLLADGPLYDALPVIEDDGWGDLYL